MYLPILHFNLSPLHLLQAYIEPYSKLWPIVRHQDRCFLDRRGLATGQVSRLDAGHQLLAPIPGLGST